MQTYLRWKELNDQQMQAKTSEIQSYLNCTFNSTTKCNQVVLLHGWTNVSQKAQVYKTHKRQSYFTVKKIWLKVWFSRNYIVIHSTYASKVARLLNSLASDRIRGFLKKKRLNARGFAWEFLRSGMLYRPGESLKRHGKSSSLHLKKNFLLGGCRFFVSDVISGGLLGHLGPLCLALGTNR